MMHSDSSESERMETACMVDLRFSELARAHLIYATFLVRLQQRYLIYYNYGALGVLPLLCSRGNGSE